MTMHDIKRRLRLGLVFVPIAAWVAGCGSPGEVATGSERDPLADPLSRQALESRIEHLEGEYVDELRSFYVANDYELAWVGEDGFQDNGKDLIRFLLGDKLGPTTHFIERHLIEIERLAEKALEAPPDSSELQAERRSELEVAMARAAFRFADQMTSGQLRPKSVVDEWFLKDQKPDLGAHLVEAVERGGVGDALLELSERHEGYVPLREGAVRYRSLLEHGGWPLIPEGDALEHGDQDPRVVFLRKRLEVTGELPASSAKSDVFDEALAGALERFQKRHGLEVDGVLGKDTLAALNVPAEERIRQIELNLERRRWMPARFGGEHVFVNIPAFQLSAYRDGELALQMRVVVGTPMNATPIFADEIEVAVFRPYWNVPVSIALDEIWPKVEKDPGYLASRNYEVVSLDDGEVGDDPVNAIRRGRARIRQRPGPTNALGLVKFLFPNSHNVYLHDTPSDHLFAQPERAFSHGCVRLERPADFARYVLRGEWSESEIAAAMREGERQTVRVAPKIPVYITYMTAWAELDGTVHFRDDVYGLDEPLARELEVQKQRDAQWRPFLAKRMRRFLEEHPAS